MFPRSTLCAIPVARNPGPRSVSSHIGVEDHCT
jgi:hypothetical protein